MCVLCFTAAILLRTKHVTPKVLCEVLKEQELVVLLDLGLSEFLNKGSKEMVVVVMVCFLEVLQEIGGNKKKKGFFKPVGKNCFL